MTKTLDVGILARICIENLLKHSKDALTENEIKDRLKGIVAGSVAKQAILDLEKSRIIAKTVGPKQTETSSGIIYEDRYCATKCVFSDPSFKKDDDVAVLIKARQDLKEKLNSHVNQGYDDNDRKDLDDIVDKLYPK